MRLSVKAKKEIIRRIEDTLVLKTTDQFVEELQTEIDKVQPSWFVEFYNDTKRKLFWQRLRLYSYTHIWLGAVSKDLYVEAGFLQTDDYDRLRCEAIKKWSEQDAALKQLQASVMAVSTGKDFLTLFRQWRQHLEAVLSKIGKKQSPISKVDVSYLNNYMS